MTNTIYWPETTIAGTASYRVERGSSSTGPWTSIRFFASDKSVYWDATLQKFYCIDDAGAFANWYRVSAVASNNASTIIHLVQNGFGLSSSTKWTTSELLASIKRRAQLPVSQVTYSDEKILSFADDVMSDDIVPTIASAREDYWSYSRDFSPSSGVVRIPERAIGNKVRSVSYVAGEGDELPLKRVEPENAYTQGGPCFYVEGNNLVIVNRQNAPVSAVRLRYFVRPGRLVKPDVVGQVVASETSTNRIQVATLPSNFSTSFRYDVVRAVPGFETLATDLTVTSVNGNVLTLSSPIPAGLGIGDRLCLAGETDIPQIPTEFHPVLAQAVTVKLHEAQGDIEAAKVAQAKLVEASQKVLGLISERIDTNPSTFLPPATWRRW